MCSTHIGKGDGELGEVEYGEKPDIWLPDETDDGDLTANISTVCFLERSRVDHKE